MNNTTTIRKTLLTGLVIAMPLIVTIWVVSICFSILDENVSPIVKASVEWAVPDQYHFWVEIIAPVISLLIIFSVTYALGFLGSKVMGRQIIKGAEDLFVRIPLVRGVYSGTRQFLDTFSGSNQKAFSQVVLIEYPRKDIWALGFVTNETQGEVQDRTADRVVSVFLPTTPNPTSGFLLFIPKNDLVVMHMSVDDAFRMIISGGVLAPKTYVCPSPKEQPME